MAELSEATLQDIEVFADRLDLAKVAATFKEFGCMVVRGLHTQYIPEISRQIEAVIAETIEQIPNARPVPEGWYTPNGSLLLPAPKNYSRDKQIMTLPLSYRNSSAFFRTALDETTLDIAEAALGPDIELFLDGQSLVKEPVGGHPKHLHQDAAYFQHRYEGPVAFLTYVVDTNLRNGALHVVPGSHKLGVLNHVDTFSHLGLDAKDWPWERSLPIEGKAGDAVVFHVNCIHGSKENHSNANRPVFINRYRAADDYTIIGATSTKNRAEAEKHAAQARKENQLGLMVRGFRRFDAKRRENQ
jgi:hypothetical protein